jgi:hypothetical protein
MLSNSTRYRVYLGQRHSPAYRVSHHVSGATLAFCRFAIPYGQHNVGEVYNSLTCRKVGIFVRSRRLQHFDGRLLNQFTKSRHMVGRERPLDVSERQHRVNRPAPFVNETGEELIRTDCERRNPDKRWCNSRKFGTQHPRHPRPHIRVIKLLVTSDPDPHFIGS